MISNTIYQKDIINLLNSIEATLEESLDECEVEGELIYLIGGDKCGNLHLFKIEKLKSHKTDEKPGEHQEPFSYHLSLIKPIQSIQNLTKENASISSIYSKRADSNKFSLICCCQDGFYRIFEFDLAYFEEDEESIEVEKQEEKVDKENAMAKPAAPMLKFVKKCQINSYIDLIESFILENDENVPVGFDIERSLKLALCFYGDKFLLWSFKLSRSLFDFKCGGANRSWGYEFQVNKSLHLT